MEGGRGNPAPYSDRAWQTDLGRWAAVKLMKEEEDPQLLSRFVRESQAAAKISHPNVVPVYEAGVVGGRHYIAMEYVEAQTLRRLRLTEREAVEAIRDAARAIEHAHKMGVIHRDVKPHNILRSDTGHIYVMDFGLAKTTAVDGSMTASGSILGTPQYMAPEQAMAGSADARTDVYGLGATMYELLTGQPPFQDPVLAGLLRQVIEDDPPAPRKINRRLSADAQTIAMKCLEKKPERRYATAVALADDCERWLKGEPIAARLASIVTKAVKWTRRHPARVLAATVLLGVVGPGIWWLIRPGEVVIAVNPPGAEIRIGGNTFKVREESFSVHLPLGNYPIQISAEGYDPVIGNIEIVRGEPYFVTDRLNRSSGSFDVEPRPKHADVLIGRQDQWSDDAAPEYPTGQYLLRARLDGHLYKGEMINLGRPDKVARLLWLEPMRVWRVQTSIDPLGTKTIDDVDGDGVDDLVWVLGATLKGVSGAHAKELWSADVPRFANLHALADAILAWNEDSEKGLQAAMIEEKTGRVRWSRALPGMGHPEIRGVAASIVPDRTGDGVPDVLLLGLIGTLHALDGATGATLVEIPDCPSGHGATIVPARADSWEKVLIFATRSAVVDLSTGEVTSIAGRPLDHPVTLPDGRAALVVERDGFVEIVASDGRTLQRVEALYEGAARRRPDGFLIQWNARETRADGAVRWTREGGWGVLRDTGDAIVATGGGDRLVRIDPETGDSQWEIPGLDGEVGTGDFDGDGAPELFAWITERGFSCIGLDGQIRWSVWFDRPVEFAAMAPDADRDGRPEVYVKAPDGVTRLHGPRFLWKSDPAANQILAAPLIVEGQVVGLGRFRERGQCSVRTFDGLSGRIIREHPVHSGIVAALASVDLTGDGVEEIVAGFSLRAEIEALDARTGAVMWSVPGSLDNHVYTTPATADLNGDGTPDVVFTTYQTMELIAADGRNGAVLWRHTFENLCGIEGIALADLDADGTPDAVVTRAEEIHAVSGHDGKPMWTQRRTFRLGPPLCADLDGDGRPEVIVSGQNGDLLILDSRTGEPAAAPMKNAGAARGHPVVVDMPDPHLLIPTGTGAGLVLYSLREKRIVWQACFDEYVLPTPVVADIDGDGTREVIVGVTDPKTMHGWVAFLDLASGREYHRVQVGTVPVETTPAVADLDGVMDVAVSVNDVIVVVRGIPPPRDF